MSYGPPPGGGYGQPSYGGAPQGPARLSPLAIISLITGIIGVIPCCSAYFLPSVAAVITGQIGKRQIEQSGGALRGLGQAKWGFILGIVGVALGLVLWILQLSGVLPDVQPQT